MTIQMVYFHNNYCQYYHILLSEDKNWLNYHRKQYYWCTCMLGPHNMSQWPIYVCSSYNVYKTTDSGPSSVCVWGGWIRGSHIPDSKFCGPLFPDSRFLGPLFPDSRFQTSPLCSVPTFSRPNGQTINLISDLLKIRNLLQI